MAEITILNTFPLARRKKRRIGTFSRRLSLSDLELRTNAGKFAHAIKDGLEAQIGNPSPGQQILIALPQRQQPVPVCSEE